MKTINQENDESLTVLTHNINKYLDFDSPLNLNLLVMVVKTYGVGAMLHYLSFYKQFGQTRLPDVCISQENRLE